MKKKFSGMFFSLPVLAVIVTLFSCAADEQTLSRYAQAKDMYARGLFSDASALLSQTGNFVPALVLRAKAEYFSGDLETAGNLCRQAIRRRPSAFEAKFYLARILGEKGEHERAEKIAGELLADNPRDIRTLRFMSALALRQGKNHEALALLDQAAELSAENAMIFLDRARLHWTAGRGGEALEDLGKAGILLPRESPVSGSVEHLEAIIKEALK